MLFHVAAAALTPGQIVQPGTWGRLLRHFRPHGPGMDGTTFDSFMWELAFESVRLAARPDLPSRLACIFACESPQDAAAFRDLCRAKARIYLVEPVDPVCAMHRGDYSLLTHTKRSAPYVEYMPADALRYWTAPPIGMVEVLIGGPVRVMGLIAEQNTAALDCISVEPTTPFPSQPMRDSMA